MFDVILGSGEQKFIFRSICVNFKILFHANLKKMVYQGGTPRLLKSLPCAENFFLILTNDIFVICDLKVIKNNRNTYHNINFDKKLPKKYSVHISGYIPRGNICQCYPCRSCAIWEQTGCSIMSVSHTPN